MKMSREPEPVRRWGVFGWCVVVVCWLVVLVVGFVLTGWLVGDTQAWSAQLSWVPAVVLLPLVVIALCLLTFVRGGMCVFLGRVLTLALFFLVAWVAGTEWGMFRADEELPDDFVVVHWNATWPGEEHDLATAYTAIEDANADLVVVTEPGQFGWGDRGGEFLEPWNYTSRAGGNVLILSQAPLQRVKPVMNAEGVVLVLVELEIMDRDATLWVLDLPSDPQRERKQIFSFLKEQVTALQIPQPDIVAGDLNVTRHSRSLEEAFPDLRNAFDEAGVGWSGTWWRHIPLWQLDQILLSRRMRCIRYEVVDPGVGTHRMQRAALRWQQAN